MHERPAPEVTVTDPARPAQSALPSASPEGAEHPRRRRWLVLVLAALVCAAAGRVVTDVVEQRRLDRVVRVSLAGPARPPATWSFERSTGRASIEAVLRLRNSGPREVRVVSGTLGRLRFDGDVRLPARTGIADVPLTRTLRCPADGSRPPREPEAGDAVLRVITPAGPREVRLSTEGISADPGRLGAHRACGYGPLEQGVEASGTVEEVRGREVGVRVRVVTTARGPARLVSLSLARGLEVVALDGGRTTLPLDLPRPLPGGQAALGLEVRARVNCGAVLASGGIFLGDVDLVLEDGDDGEVAQVTGRLDGGAVLRQVVERTCSSGERAS